MNGTAMLSNMLATASRWANLVPGLLRHDPLFRYAAIAAGLALFFLIVRVAQEFAGPGAISPSGLGRVEQNPTDSEDTRATGITPPVPGSATVPPKPEDAIPPVIAPGRSLEGMEVAPAPRDNFGTLPRGENAK